jgi:hypothetical protein
MNKNPGRKLRRLAAREAQRNDGKQRNSFTERPGNGVAIYRSGRQAGR